MRSSLSRAGRASPRQGSGHLQAFQALGPCCQECAQQLPTPGAHLARGLSEKDPSENTVSPEREVLVSTLR